MIVIYDRKLVLLSVLIAVLASYFALEVVRQIVVAQESVRKYSEETQPPRQLVVDVCILQCWFTTIICKPTSLKLLSS